MALISLAKFASLQKISTPLTFQKVFGPGTDQSTLKKLILEAFQDSGINVSRTSTGRINLENVTDQTINKFNSSLRQKKAEAGLPRSRYEVENEKTEIKKFVQKKLKNKEYVSIPRIFTEFPNTSDMTIRRALGKNLVKKLGKEEAAEASRKTFQTTAKAKLTESDDVIKAINEEFKFDPDVPDSETIAKRIYGSDFDNADTTKKLGFITQTENDLIKYLKVLEGAREKPKGMVLPKQAQINDIVDNMLAGGEREGFRKGFRFSPGVLRDYQFSIRDTLLNLKEGTTLAKRKKLGTKKGMELDEIFSLGATFRKAPGYTEAFQFIPSKINQQKRTKIDKPLSSLLDAIEQNKTEVQYGGKKVSIEKAVQLFNKDSKAFGNKNKILTPQINLGKPLDDVSAYSPEAQKNIQEVFKTKNYSLSVQKPKSKLKTFGAALATPTIAASPTMADDDVTYMQAGYNLDSDVDYGDPETWNLKVGDFLETGAVTAAVAPLATKKGRSIYGKAAGTIARGVGTPLGIGLLTAGLSPEGGYDLSKQEDRLGFEVEAALSKDLVRQSQAFARKIPASRPLLRRATQTALNLGIPGRFATTAARVATPLGLLSLAGEAGLFTYREAMKTKEAIDAMSEEEKQNYLSQQELDALAAEATFASGGRVGFDKSGPDDD
jgi:hypothetical protein|tara:strand:+ start:366 stop:2357 length:1992 start_codon:yes stop_codon:yes gene_type:complete